MGLFVCRLDGLEIGLLARFEQYLSAHKEGGNGAIRVNGLRKCMKTFIIYLL